MWWIKYLVLRLKQEKEIEKRRILNEKIKKEFHEEMSKIQNKIFICNNNTIH